MWKNYNANPRGLHTGDCTIRAISTALGEEYEETLAGISIYALVFCDLPSSNRVWGEYLKSQGFRRKPVECDCTVSEFADNHSKGVYVLALSGHVVAVVDGIYYDTWDSGDEYPVYYWIKEA